MPINDVSAKLPDKSLIGYCAVAIYGALGCVLAVGLARFLDGGGGFPGALSILLMVPFGAILCFVLYLLISRLLSNVKSAADWALMVPLVLVIGLTALETYGGAFASSFATQRIEQTESPANADAVRLKNSAEAAIASLALVSEAVTQAEQQDMESGTGCADAVAAGPGPRVQFLNQRAQVFATLRGDMRRLASEGDRTALVEQAQANSTFMASEARIFTGQLAERDPISGEDVSCVNRGIERALIDSGSEMNKLVSVLSARISLEATDSEQPTAGSEGLQRFDRILSDSASFSILDAMAVLLALVHLMASVLIIKIWRETKIRPEAKEQLETAQALSEAHQTAAELPAPKARDAEQQQDG